MSPSRAILSITTVTSRHFWGRWVLPVQLLMSHQNCYELYNHSQSIVLQLIANRSSLKTQSKLIDTFRELVPFQSFINRTFLHQNANVEKVIYMSLADWIGFLGVFQILLAYFLNITGRLSSRHYSFILLNLIGAAMACLASILINYLPFIVLEGIWALVSVYALQARLREGN